MSTFFFTWPGYLDHSKYHTRLLLTYFDIFSPLGRPSLVTCTPMSTNAKYDVKWGSVLTSLTTCSSGGGGVSVHGGGGGGSFGYRVRRESHSRVGQMGPIMFTTGCVSNLVEGGAFVSSFPLTQKTYRGG